MTGVPMRFLLAGALIILMSVSAFSSDLERREIEKEIERLEALKKEIVLLKGKNEELLKQIREERRKLQEERLSFEERIKEVRSERYRRLGKVFEKMEPEMAGQKLSKMKDPKEAAYIILNMKERAAGSALNYVDPKRVSEIVKILTQIKGSN